MSRYNANVRIGNWFSELVMQEEILKQYVRRSEKSELKVQKARKLFLSLLTEVPLTFPVQGLSYGAVLQIMSKDAPTAKIFKIEKNQGMTLAANIHYEDIDSRSAFYIGDPVIATGLLTPCVRNVWTLVPCDPSLKNKPVRFGDSFYIQLYSNKFPLYVEALVSGPTVPRGECGEVVPKLVGQPGPNTREKRTSCLDLQTFTVHFPASAYKAISVGKIGHYPVALIPGQNTDYYKEYTSTELKYYPLNTVLYGPVRPNSRRFIRGGSDGSQSDSDDSTSSDDSSSSSSGETQDTETSSTVDDESASEVKAEKEKPPEKVEEKVVVEKKGRGRPLGSGKKNQNPDQPKKRLGRPPKIRPPLPVATVSLKKLEDEDPNYAKKEIEKTQNLTCKMCHEEESKNKNGEFEQFINCAQCKGKIHPSCIDLTADMIPKISSYGWQCTDCKTCVKCDQSSSEDKMIFCDQCDRGYHIFCVGLKKVPSGNYICTECKPLPAPPSGVAEIASVEEDPVIKEEKVEIKTEEAE